MAEFSKPERHDQFIQALRMAVSYHVSTGLTEREVLAIGLGFLINFHRQRRGRRETEEVVNRALGVIERSETW